MGLINRLIMTFKQLTQGSKEPISKLVSEEVALTETINEPELEHLAKDACNVPRDKPVKFFDVKHSADSKGWLVSTKDVCRDVQGTLQCAEYKPKVLSICGVGGDDGLVHSHTINRGCRAKLLLLILA